MNMESGERRYSDVDTRMCQNSGIRRVSIEIGEGDVAHSRLGSRNAVELGPRGERSVEKPLRRGEEVD